jgi:hypothetical protein
MKEHGKPAKDSLHVVAYNHNRLYLGVEGGSCFLQRYGIFFAKDSQAIDFPWLPMLI